MLCVCFSAVCILGGAFSSYFRCSVLLIFPSMLGSRGRAYLMLFVLYGLYRGKLKIALEKMYCLDTCQIDC